MADDPGKLAYNAYAQYLRSKHPKAAPMPRWEHLVEPLHSAWRAAAAAVMKPAED